MRAWSDSRELCVHFFVSASGVRDLLRLLLPGAEDAAPVCCVLQRAGASDAAHGGDIGYRSVLRGVVDRRVCGVWNRSVLLGT